ncbi:hypothetical protein TNCV_2952181 [Trichonephila clavipes]|nr:hypothetical protein TNCV_2952181 [Trichonephila clavipes]
MLLPGKAFVMPHVRCKNSYQHVSDFDEVRAVAYRYCCLSDQSIAARVSRDPMSVRRVGNRWLQDGNTEGRAGSQSVPHH